MWFPRTKSQEQILVAFLAIMVWFASLIVRVIKPSLAPLFTGLDSIMLLVFGYLFSVQAIRHRNGSTNPPQKEDPQ